MSVASLFRTAAVVALTSLACRPAAADVVTEVELEGTAVNNSIGTAQSVQAGFGPVRPATAFDVPGNFSHLTILGFGGTVFSDAEPAVNTDVDFYSFTTAGGRAYFDVDNDPFTFDAILSLFDANGTLVAFNDDSFPADAGSESGFDAFLGVVDLPGGTYYLAVTEFDNFATETAAGAAELTRPDGGPGGIRTAGAAVGDSSFRNNGVQPDVPLPYTVYVAVENVGGGGNPPPAVPAPPAALLGLIGISAVGLRRAVRRRAG